LGRGTIPTSSAFLTAVERDDVQCLKLLVNASSQRLLETHRWNMLVSAGRMGRITAMEYLLQLPGIKVTQTDKHKRNLLHIVTMSGHVEAVDFILRNITTSVSAVDEEGKTALHYAVMSGNLLVIRLLLPQASSDILKEDFKELSPLDYAIKRDSILVVHTLINSMLPDDPLRHQSAALRHAVSECHSMEGRQGRLGAPQLSQFHLPSIQILQTLLKSEQFDLNAGDSSGRTALHIAVSQPYWLSEPVNSSCTVAKSRLNLLLTMAGINVDASDGEGRTPIFCILDSEKDAVRSYDFDE